MFNFLKENKQSICKSAAAAVFCILFAGVSMTAIDRIQASGTTGQGGNTAVTATATTGSAVVSANYQKAGASSSGAITAYIDWEAQDLKLVSTTGDEYFYISDAKMKSWDEIEAEKAANGTSTAYCDLSWITKDYELNIRGDKDASDVIKISIAAPRKLKAKFSIANEVPKIVITVTETVNKKKETRELQEAEMASVLWRKSTAGKWRPYSQLDLDSFMTKGVTLNLCLAGSCDSDLSKCYMPSKVASVKVKKKANAPSTKIDPAKLTLGVKKGQEYMVITGTTRSSIINITDSKDASPALSTIASGILGGDGYEKTLPAFTVKVRTSSTNTKTASKWKTITYPQQRTITGSSITVKLSADGKGATVQNNTAYNIEYMVPETNMIQTIKSAGITEKTKWSTVKANKTATCKVSTLTTGTAIFFRYAAEKDNTKTLESEAELVSVIGITHPVQ